MKSRPRATLRTGSWSRLVMVLAFCLIQSNCSQYHVGGSKPVHLQSISRVEVSLVQNRTQVPRAAAHATNSLIDAITSDGTYRISGAEDADARLVTTLQRINYRQARSTRVDILRSEELEMEVHLVWTLVDARSPSRLLAKGKSIGKTRFFVDPNLQTARQMALIDALKRAADAVVTSLADGF